MQSGWLAAALEPVRGVDIDESAVLAHVMPPDFLLDVHSDQGLDSGPAERAVRPPPFPSPVPVFYTFDATGFISALEELLANTTAGYSIGLAENGSAIALANHNWAKEPQDGGEGWTPDTRMHVASLSKLVTAIAMTRLLGERGISPDTPVIDYLPGYWAKGLNIGRVTFADLMAHTSGLAYESSSSRSDFLYMKEQIAAGTTNIGHYSYQNVNYGLCRILLATVLGSVPVDWDPGLGFTDVLWDLATIQVYAWYVNNCVFAPAGVTGPGFTHAPADALAYDWPVTGIGWNSGDLSPIAGADAWHLSVNELLSVMGTFRRGGTIVSTAQAQAMLDAGFGLNQPIADTQLGPVYYKIGTWYNGSGRWEQGVAFFLPLNMELVILVNSPVGGVQDGNLLYWLAWNEYLDHIVEIPRPVEP